MRIYLTYLILRINTVDFVLFQIQNHFIFYMGQQIIIDLDSLLVVLNDVILIFHFPCVQPIYRGSLDGRTNISTLHINANLFVSYTL